MGRYSDIEWAGKTVRDSIDFILAVTEQMWRYGPMNNWEATTKCIQQLGIEPLVKAYDAVAKNHDLPKYSGHLFVAGLIGSNRNGADQELVRKEAAFVVATFENAMQFMATNPGWQEAQDGMEKVALERLENLIRIVRGFRSSYDEKQYLDKNPKVAA
jgi:hypothetical protein